MWYVSFFRLDKQLEILILLIIQIGVPTSGFQRARVGMVCGTPTTGKNLHSELSTLFSWSCERINGEKAASATLLGKYFINILYIRIDQLGTILIHEFFAYYKYWPLDE